MEKQKFSIVVHGGAGGDSNFIKENLEGYKKGLQEAIEAGWEVLKENGSAVDAVEAAVNVLEDNPLFNSGRGSAINAKAEVEMCASIMDGKDCNSGAVAIVKNVKHPVSLAKSVMKNTNYLYLGGEGALDYAKKIEIQLEPDSYFVTEHQYDTYVKAKKDEFQSTRKTAMEQITSRMHGTVGAVAVDVKGNIAAATSTGGTENSKEGRIGDSSMIGVGCYANNKTCAVSITGDGEYVIRGVIAYDISCAVEYKRMELQEACDYVINKRNKDVEGDIGAIAVNADGDIALCFNSERMHRAWKTSSGDEGVAIYKE
jgi:beta-aspartyl-peptidase (threonine type)